MGALKKIAHQCSNCGAWMMPNEPKVCSQCVVDLAELDEDVPVKPVKVKAQ